MIRAAVLALVFAVPAAAQQQIPGTEDLFDGEETGDLMREDWENGILVPLNQDRDITREENERVLPGNIAVLRGLDRLTGVVRDIELRVGQTRGMGRLQVQLAECRFPEANPSGDAYAYLTIRDDGAERPDFAGWMVASSPALNPLDHPRYDVWVIRCST